MHNRIGFNRLNRKSSHRKALHRNMVTSLIKYERIETTKAKAKEIRRTAEKLVTRAKIDSVHNRRIAAKTIYEKEMLNKLFTVVGPRFTERPGGYTRMLKLGNRSGDAAEMVILEFLKDEETKSPAKKTSAKKKTAAKGGSTKPSAPKDADSAKPAPESPAASKEKEAENAASNKAEDDKTAETAAAESKPVKDAADSTEAEEGGEPEVDATDESGEKDKAAE